MGRFGSRVSASRAGDSPTDSISVLFVNQYYKPAEAPTARLLADVAEALAAEGHDVRVIASRRGYRDASDRFPRRDQIAGVHVRRVGGTGFSQAKRWGRLINYFAFFASAGRQLLLTRRPDVVVSLSTPPLLSLVVHGIASLRRARFVYWVMDVHPELAFRLGHLRRTSLTGRILEWSGRRSLAKADTVIVLGDDMAKEVHPHSNGNTQVIRTWADGDAIRPRRALGHPLRAEWGWEGRFVIAYSGNMGLVHEFDTMLDAATQLNADDRYLFCFIGGGAREAEVRAETKRRQLSNVEFREYVSQEDLPMSLTAPDLHVVSLRDNLAGLSVPSKACGVLAAGKPIAFVGPKTCDVASIVRTDGCGVHVRNGDGVALANAIRTYGESAATVNSHSVAARATFETLFSETTSIATFIHAIGL